MFIKRKGQPHPAIVGALPVRVGQSTPFEHNSQIVGGGPARILVTGARRARVRVTAQLVIKMDLLYCSRAYYQNHCRCEKKMDYCSKREKKLKKHGEESCEDGLGGWPYLFARSKTTRVSRRGPRPS